MCGRFTLRTPAQQLAELFQLSEVPDLPPRYNIAPSQDVAAEAYPVNTIVNNPRNDLEECMQREDQ